MLSTTNRIEPELSRLTKIRPVTKILSDGKFREGLESMVISYKLSMTEHSLLRSSAPPAPVPAAQSSLLSQRRRETSDVIGDASRFSQLSSELRLLTIKLAVACRLIDHFGWYQPILTHCSARTQSGHTVFTPASMLFSRAAATQLLVLAADSVLPGQEVDRGSLLLHQRLASGSIECVITVNTPVCAAIASLKYGLLPLSRDFLQLGEIEYTDAESLLSYTPEGRVIFIRNQGLAVVGSSVEEAFYRLFHVLTACSVQAIALSAGPEKILPMRHDLHSITNSSSPSQETYKAYFENLSKLVTENDLSSLAGTNNLQIRQEIEYGQLDIQTNPFLPLTTVNESNTNPFLPLENSNADDSVLFAPEQIWSDDSSVWDFTKYFFPCEQIWNFLPQMDLNSNPITHASEIAVERTRVWDGEISVGDDYDDLI